MSYIKFLKINSDFSKTIFVIFDKAVFKDEEVTFYRNERVVFSTILEEGFKLVADDILYAPDIETVLYYFKFKGVA